MVLAVDGIEADQIAGQMKSGDLLITLLGDGVGLDGAGANGIERL